MKEQLRKKTKTCSFMNGFLHEEKNFCLLLFKKTKLVVLQFTREWKV